MIASNLCVCFIHLLLGNIAHQVNDGREDSQMTVSVSLPFLIF